MSESFEKIKPLIKKAVKKGKNYSFVFQSEFGEPVMASYSEGKASSVLNSVRNSLFSIIGASESYHDKTLDDYYVELQQAAVMAFKQVSNRFIWNDSIQRWAYAEVDQNISNFEDFLKKNQIKDEHHKRILIRLLASIASSDNNISKEEKEFLADFFKVNESDLNKIIKEGPPSIRDLQDVHPISIRETMIMIAWSIAMTDEDVNESERFSIGFYAGTMGISRIRTDELKNMSAHFVLEKSAESIRTDTRINPMDINQELNKRLFDIADQIGYTDENRKDEIHRIINRQLMI